jgi:hypothetical protein
MQVILDTERSGRQSPSNPIGTRTRRPRFHAGWTGWGEIHVIKDLPPPTEAEEYRNTAEILRDLAAQLRFDNTRNALVNLAENLDRLAAHAEGHRAVDRSPSRATSEAQALNSDGL